MFNLLAYFCKSSEHLCFGVVCQFWHNSWHQKSLLQKLTLVTGKVYSNFSKQGSIFTELTLPLSGIWRHLVSTLLKLCKTTLTQHLWQKGKPRRAQRWPHQFCSTQLTALSVRRKRLIPPVPLKAFSCCKCSVLKLLIRAYHIIPCHKTL